LIVFFSVVFSTLSISCNRLSATSSSAAATLSTVFVRLSCS
jgi:hypothetical protein